MSVASRRTSPAPRRVVALKRADGEPLTRADIQYDFLNAVFSDSKEVFTDPHSPTNIDQPTKLCFRDLYIKAILHSPKATKALKDKMGETSTFAVDFAMLSLLVNVGRVNTTMSCQCMFSLNNTPLDNTFSSLSGNEDSDSHIPPHPLAPENQWQHAGCSTYQTCAQDERLR